MLNVLRMRREAQDLARGKGQALGGIELETAIGDEVECGMGGEGGGIPMGGAGMFAIEVDEDEERRRSVDEGALDGEEVAVAAFDEGDARGGAKSRMCGEDGVEAGNQGDDVRGRVPVEGGGAVDIDLVGGKPFHAVGD